MRIVNSGNEFEIHGIVQKQNQKPFSNSGLYLENLL